MKTLTLNLICSLGLGISLTCSLASAQGVGSRGNDFNYMRSLEALTAGDFDKILQDGGSAFMNNEIAPASWVGFQYLYQDSEVLDHLKLDPSSKTVWKQLLGNGFETLWNQVKQTKLENCSCEKVFEPESSSNQTCNVRDPISNQAKICIDLKKVFDPAQKLNLNYDDLMGGIWHELAHLYTQGISHSDIYHFGLKLKKQSQLGVLKSVSSSGTKDPLCEIAGNKTESKDLADCISQAWKTNPSKKIRIEFRSGESKFKGWLEATQKISTDAPSFQCELEGNHGFIDSLLTEKTSSMYQWFGDQMPTRSIFKNSIADLNFGIVFGNYRDDATWYLDMPAKDPQSCIYAFYQGFYAVKIYDSRDRSIFKMKQTW